VTGSIGSAPYRHGVADLHVDGRPTRVLVDTAGTALCVRQSVAEELGLTIHEWLGDPSGAPIAVLDPPELRAGDAVLDTEGLVAYGFEDVRALGLEARGADVLLPAAVLRRHHVVLDDPAGELHVGPPGSLERRGVAVPVTIDGATGIVMTTAEVDGSPLDLVIDTAVGCCLVSDEIVRPWQAGHADWPASASAVGPANMTGLPTEARVPMLRVPLVQWGPFSLPQVAFAWRAGADVAAAGSLGGNALRLFRLDVDWSAGSVRAEQGLPFGDDDTELVGVVLGLDADGGYFVTATVSGLDDVHPGDRFVAVDGRDVDGMTLPDVLDLLRGTAGDRHRLSLRRDDEAIEVDAPVLRLL